MITASQTSAIRVAIGQGDVRTIQQGKTWEQFEFLQKGFANTHGVRLFYYENIIEIIMPGATHELFKSIIGFLLETFLFNRQTEFKPTGSMTQKKDGLAAAEADESYEIDSLKLLIEVNFTSGNVSKLECYQLLGVDAVWFWEDGTLAVYHLQPTGYQQVDRSQISPLAAINLEVLAECILLGETSRITAANKLLATHPID
jgi:Uma2 family endonuclease